MSYRTDNYLNLCLAEAANSPLHYRHGAVIVRGGKILGRGHNAYRSGFDGGALKTGSHGTTATLSDHPKSKPKPKRKSKSDSSLPSNAHCRKPSKSTDAFHPFEYTSGGGHLANTPLSMHSEMMAIQSALGAITALSSRAFASEKPCYKLPGDSKRKARLRRANLEKYVEAVCRAALGEQREATAEGGEWRFETGAFGQSAVVQQCGGGRVQSQRERERVREEGERECGGSGPGCGGRDEQYTTFAAMGKSGVRPGQEAEVSASSPWSSSQLSTSRTCRTRTTTGTTPFWSDAAACAAAPACATAA